MKWSFIPHATHAEAEGAIVAALREDGARAEVEVARETVASVARQRCPIVAAGARVGQLAELAAFQARSRQEQ